MNSMTTIKNEGVRPRDEDDIAKLRISDGADFIPGLQDVADTESDNSNGTRKARKLPLSEDAHRRGSL